MPYLIGIAGLVVIWIIYRLISGSWNVMLLASGGDGLPSSSQFQFLLWTVVIIFSYITVYVSRIQDSNYTPISDIPVNLLVLMGISGFALVASKGITQYHLSRGDASIKDASVKEGGDKRKMSKFKYLICDDNGNPTLNKLQMIAWTFIAIAIYIFLVTKEVGGTELAVLPDVDEALLVLMGISQGTYLGKRLVTTTTPTLRRLTPPSAAPGQEVTLEGLNMGDIQGGSLVKVGDLFPSEITSWKDGEVKFSLPQKLDKNEYPVSVFIGSKESNKLTISIG